MSVKRSILDILRRAGKPPRSSESGRVGRWGVGAGLTITILVATRLGLPQPIEPTEIPFPTLDAISLKRQYQAQTERVKSTQSATLPLGVRAVGELVRRLGAAEAEERSDEASLLGMRLRAQAKRMLSDDRQGLLRLRALQTKLFVAAAVAWDAAAAPPVDLTELGGAFASHARAPVSRGVTRLDAGELGAAYRVRWSQLTGLEQHIAFAPSVNDARLNARLKLRWAEGERGTDRHRLQLSTIQDLAKVDVNYPESFAIGVSLYQVGAYAEAFEYFAQHLRVHPDGPWTLRAQNHALAAAAIMVGSE